MKAIGEIIRINREAREISQETLAYGICSVSNLSRIENGQQTPGRATCDALLQRLGLPPDVYPSFVSEKEAELFRLKHEINEHFNAERFDEAETLLKRFDSMQRLEKTYRQYAAYIRTLLLRRKGGAPEDVLAAMKAVVAASIQDFEPRTILKKALSKEDLSILNNLAVSYLNVGEEEYGIEILYSLKDYIERRIVDDEGFTILYTMILYNLSKLATVLDETIALCDIGIARCIKYRRYLWFADLLYNKGYALTKKGELCDAKKYLQESYYIDRAIGKTESYEHTEKFAIKHDIDLFSKL